MLSFLTLFLGLTVGPQTVELAVGTHVAAVELFLDGRAVAETRREPWALPCDFGADLLPHELLAVGRDAAGREIARVRQWVNLPRPRSEIVLLLEASAAEGGQARTARLLWQSVEARRPSGLTVTFDGTVLPVAESGRIDLPDYDPSRIHLLSAEAEVGRRIVRAERIVGGERPDSVRSELTAVPVVVRDGAELPPAEALQGWFASGGRPLEVVAVEDPPAEIVLVRPADLGFRSPLHRLGRDIDYVQAKRDSALPFGLRHRDRVRLLFPNADPEAAATLPAELFSLTQDLAPILPAGLLTAATHRFEREGQERRTTEPQLMEAVAVAGLAAAEGGRARAVVVALDDDAPDASRFDWPLVKRYLESLRVPLVVWSPLGRKKIPAWADEVVDVRSSRQLVTAVDRLRLLLDRQRIVWVAGRPLPQRVELSAPAGEILRLAGEPLPVGFLGEPKPAPGAKTAERPAIAAAEPREPDGATVAGDGASFDEVVEVRVVNIEVRVRDRQGRPVPALRRDDFELFEDGRRVEITQFEAIGEADGGTSGGTAAGAETVSGPPSGPPEHWLIYLDEAHLPATRRRLVLKRLAKAFTELRQRRGAMPLRVLLLRGGTRIRLTGDFPQPGPEIAAALEELGAGSPGHTPWVAERSRLFNDITAAVQELAEAERTRDPFAIAAAEANRDRVVTGLSAFAESRRHDVLGTLASLANVIRAFGGLPGRKTLLYVGDGLTLTPAADLYDAAEKWLGLPETRVARLTSEAGSLGTHREVERLVRQANGDGVTFYTLSAGDSRPLLLSAELGASLPAAGSRFSVEGTRDTQLREGICLLSNSTGGSCRTAGDAETLIRAAMEDSSLVYSLGYAPDHRGDGKYHRLEVKVRRKGLSIRHREGYLDKPREERLRDRLVSAVVFGVEENPHGVRVEALAAVPGEDGVGRVPLRVSVPLERLVLLPRPPEEKLELQARILVLLQAADGSLGEIREVPVRREIAAAELPPGRSVTYANTVELSLPAGTWKLAVGLWDENGLSGSFVPAVVEVAGPSAARE